MRYFSKVIFLLLLSGFTYSGELHPVTDVVKIKVVTEDSFPLQYFESGKLSGFATTLVEQVLDAANISYHIEVLPWARAYRVALYEPNVLIYSIAKTSKRADKFKWVGEIKALDYYLYGAIDSSVNPQTTLEELKQYRIGVIRDSAVYQYLHGHDFKNLTTVVQGKQNLLLFQQNRIDLLPANKLTFQAICKKKALNCQSLKALYKLDMPAIKLYMALSQLSDDALVEKVRAGYRQVMKQ